MLPVDYSHAKIQNNLTQRSSVDALLQRPPYKKRLPAINKKHYIITTVIVTSRAAAKLTAFIAYLQPEEGRGEGKRRADGNGRVLLFNIKDQRLIFLQQSPLGALFALLSAAADITRNTYGDIDVISMPASFHHHLMGKTLQSTRR